MTATEKISRANRWRIDDGTSWEGSFLVPVDGESWHVVTSDHDDWRLLYAVNALTQTQYPTYAVMFRLRDLFFDDEATVLQFVHTGPNSLWEYMDHMPTP